MPMTSFKSTRKDYNSKMLTRAKLVREFNKDYQRGHHGSLPEIPRGTYYCYRVIDVDFNKEAPPVIHCKVCPYWYYIPIEESELDDHVGVVATGQKGIGGCRYLNLTDDDMQGWGLLWDQCKECDVE